MKIYVGQRKIDSEQYKTILDPTLINLMCEDAEAEAIILDGVIRRHFMKDVPEIIAMCHKKLRTKGILKIIDIDFDLLSSTYVKRANIADLNNIFTTEIRSFMTYEFLHTWIHQNFPDLKDHGANLFGVEFDLELIRE